MLSMFSLMFQDILIHHEHLFLHTSINGIIILSNYLVIIRFFFFAWKIHLF